MVSKVSTPIILQPSGRVSYEKNHDTNLFVGEWTELDTLKMCNPSKYRKKFKQEDIDRKKL